MNKKGIIICNYYDEYDEKYPFQLDISVVDLALKIHVDFDNNLEEQLQNKEEFIDCMNYKLNQLKIFNPNFYNEEKKYWDFYNSNFETLIESAAFVQLDLFDINIVDYVKKHPKLKNKKIVLNEYFDIGDLDKIKALEEKYKDIKDNLYFLLEGNNMPVSFKDCYKTIDYINSTCKHIKKMNLSPFEELMYAYDIVRNRVYKDDENDKSKSRDLTSALFGDSIVCVGFSNIYNAIIKYLGFNKIRKVDTKLDENGEGHEFIFMYIQDAKYDIDGAYFIDPTNDCKIDEYDKYYLNDYYFFAKTMEEFEDYIYDGNLLFSNGIVTTNELFDKMNDLDSVNFLEKINFINRIDSLSEFLYGHPYFKEFSFVNAPDLKENKEIIIEDVMNMLDAFDRKIPGKVMLDALRKVRKIEYYEKPEYFPYDINSLFKASVHSDWNFGNEEGPDLIIREILKTRVPIHQTKKYFDTEKEDIKKEIGQVKLTRTLRNALDKKTHVE